ncbi:hypothetical protein [Methylobacterium nigriterrae]|uniref:hypothetical protein n=1 Tax=Methylobacterium nigriterrae TaxID=3127512 RepID=UPI003014059C
MSVVIGLGPSGCPDRGDAPHPPYGFGQAEDIAGRPGTEEVHRPGGGDKGMNPPAAAESDKAGAFLQDPGDDRSSLTVRLRKGDQAGRDHEQEGFFLLGSERAFTTGMMKKPLDLKLAHQGAEVGRRLVGAQDRLPDQNGTAATGLGAGKMRGLSSLTFRSRAGNATLHREDFLHLHVTKTVLGTVLPRTVFV